MPNFTLLLPIYDTTAKRCENCCQSKHCANPPARAIAEPFTLGTLQRLSLHGLRPFPKALKVTDDSCLAHKLVCYPWLIAETGSVQSVAVDMTRLAASAAVCALRMQKRLTRYSAILGDQSHVLPVTVVTAVGQNVTVWIAYYAENDINQTHFQECNLDRDGIHQTEYVSEINLHVIL